MPHEETSDPTNETPERDTAGFPRELLQAPWEQRFEYLKRYRLPHPFFDENRALLIEKIVEPCGRRTIHVFGPTGAGKTTLCEIVTKHFLTTVDDRVARTNTSLPLVLDAFASESHRYGWKDFYRQWLFQLQNMHREHRIEFGITGMRYSATGALLIEERVSVFNLRAAAIRLTKALKPVAIMIDEAPHIKKLASGENIESQMDVLKTLSDQTETVFVLIGTYEMLAMINQNGQQGRRSRDIHLRRYLFKGADKADFLDIINTIQKHLPFSQEPDLLIIARDLYKGCLGCVGILMNWVYDTVYDALKAGKNTLILNDFKKHQLEPGKRIQIARDIQKGEETIKRIQKECEEELDKLLGLKPIKLTK